MDWRSEVAHLQKAEADIAEARVRIRRQEELVARLREHGLDISTAQSVLETMRDTLNAMEGHRQLILDHLASIKVRPW